MFGRSVKIGGKEYFVMCSPNTPFSQVLESAARMAWKDEEAARAANPVHQAYQRALENSRM